MNNPLNTSKPDPDEQKKVDPEKCVSYKTFINDIATELAYNYMTVSFGETYKDGYLVAGIDNEEEVKRNIFKDPNAILQTRGNWSKCRNILVIGSGASFDAYRSIPLGKNTKEQVLKRLKLSNLLDANQDFMAKFEEEAERILANRMGKIPKKSTEGSLILSDKFDFESFLHLLTLFFREQDIRSVIHDIFNVRYAPSLFYEVVAHLFKHSFIDVIVNFNFDEMLDQGIKEEMGRGSYHEIFSDGHCMDISEIVVDGRLKKPLYIKPHGTISHKSSLRFTKNHYFDLPDDMQVLLSQLLGGQLKSDPDAPRLERINLITVGFNLESIEFNSIIESNAKRIKLYSIVHNELPRIFENDEMESTCVRHGIEDGKYQLLSTAHLPVTADGADKPNHSSLAGIAINLFTAINDIFNEPYKPRGLERHYLYHDFFYNKIYGDSSLCPPIDDLKYKFNSAEFFKIRVVLEIGICLACGRGIVELKELMKERLGELYKLYRNFHDKEQLNSLPETLYDLADVFKLKEELSFSRNVHNLPLLQKKELPAGFFNEDENDKGISSELAMLASVIFDKNDFLGTTVAYDSPIMIGKTIIYRLLNSKRISGEFKKQFINEQHQWDKAKILRCIQHFSNLFLQGYYQNISPRFDDPRLFVFDHYFKDQILHTNLSYSYRFEEVFKEVEQWDYLFVSTDTGQYLDMLVEKLGIKLRPENRIYLITCYESIRDKSKAGEYIPVKNVLSSHFGKLKNLKAHLILRTLPYSDHNHHMTIFTKKNNEHKVFPISIYPAIQIRDPNGNAINHVFPRSIYFYKKGFSNLTNPLWVRGAFAFMKDKTVPPPSNFATNLLSRDHQMLLETFYAYHRKSQAFLDYDGQYLEFLPAKEFNFEEVDAANKSRAFNLNELFWFMDEAPQLCQV